jgi:hypothetical protein
MCDGSSRAGFKRGTAEGEKREAWRRMHPAGRPPGGGIKVGDPVDGLGKWCEVGVGEGHQGGSADILDGMGWDG